MRCETIVRLFAAIKDQFANVPAAVEISFYLILIYLYI